LECEGRGLFEVTQPFAVYETADVLRAMYATRQAEHGCWPVGGGWLDQTQKCLDAIDFINGEKAECKRRNEEA
jgi:hypothetical protein